MSYGYRTRKIDSSFKKDGETFKVVEQDEKSKHLCENCSFFEKDCTENSFLTKRGLCAPSNRKDKKVVIFVKQEK